MSFVLLPKTKRIVLRDRKTTLLQKNAAYSLDPNLSRK
jgi:hypothetical protein